MSGPDYSTQSQYQQNYADLHAQPVDRADAARSLAERSGMSPEILLHGLMAEQAFQLAMTTSPQRQNTHEKVALAWLQGMPLIENVAKLASSGPSALYVHQGLLLSHKDLPNLENAKSVDFYFTLAIGALTRSYYAAHKHTLQDGGAQDNQFQDLKNFASNAVALKRETQKRYLALADGAYYSKARKTTTHLADLQALVAPSAYCAAMACSGLPAYLGAQAREMIAAQNLAPSAELSALVAAVEAY
jgi:hypothetical protein